MSLATMLRTTCTQKRPTTIKDESGGASKTFASVTGAVDVPCDIQPASGSVRMQYMQQQAQAVHTIYFSQEVTPRAGDIFVSGSRTFQFLGRRPAAPGYQVWPTIVDVEEQFG